MKSLTLCLVLLATVATLHRVSCQEETVTTTLAPQVEDAKEVPTTEVPTPVETAPAAESTSPATEETKTELPETKPNEELPKEEEKKEEPKEEEKAPEPKDEQPAEPKEGEGAAGEQENIPPQQLPPPQEPPKIIFVQQTIRDPITGMIYTRQVPLIPTNFMRPNQYQPDGRRDGPPPQEPRAQEPQPPQQPSAFDPLGQFNDSQKKRQFYQDMLMSQLARFEREIEPLVEREENITEKNDIEELLGKVAELKQSLEAHQIFNISDIMNNWKQGKLQGGESNLNEQQRPPQSGPPMQLPPPNLNRPRNPPITLRTLILVPQTRLMNPQGPQQPQYNPYPVSRQIPVIHIRRGPYQPMYETEPQQPRNKPQQPLEQLEPQPMSGTNEEYHNTNEIFGY